MSAETPITQPQRQRELPIPLSHNSQSVQEVPEENRLPRLGNFSRILASSIADWEPSPLSDSLLETESQSILYEDDDNDDDDDDDDDEDDDEDDDGNEPRAGLRLGTCAGLGDFRRVFNQFHALVSAQNSTNNASSSTQDLLIGPGRYLSADHFDPSCNANDAAGSDLVVLQSKAKPFHLGSDTRLTSSIKQPPFTVFKRPVATQSIAEDSSCSGDDSKSDSDRCLQIDSLVITPASTPPSPQPKKFVSVEKSLISNKVGKAKTRSKSPSGILLSYHRGKDSSTTCHVYGRLRTKEQKHESLMMELTPNRVLDASIAKKYSKVASHGIHVFVDMSNIDIGFQKALRVRYKLGDNAHFSPLPHLNLEFLNEVLIRGRTAVTRSVGCSVVPGRPEPRYIQELQSLGYHVDLRERKAVQDAKSASTNVRYVEDLVDETLQTRIAESVMEYFQEQGTIILATGDAKPAQYSDGFFAYAERALRMGWHMEVASWKGSLSSAWTSRKWKAQWGIRFRIIELDDFLDNILAFDL